MLCTVLYPRVHNEYSKHCTKKKPYRAKRLGIQTLGMQLCFYETVFAKESAISGRDRNVCSSHAGILFVWAMRPLQYLGRGTKSMSSRD